MSKLWLCEGKTAEEPFWLEEEEIRIATMEELCYYLYQNIEIIEEAFFCESLFLWIEQELDQRLLAQKLRQGMEQKKSSFWYIGTILTESGYMTLEELRGIQEIAVRFDTKNSLERGKLRADRMMKHKKYKKAITEYRKLLKKAKEDGVLEKETAPIWHNMGTGYARQMLFAQGAECFEKAYQLGQQEESRRSYLISYACAKGEKTENTNLECMEKIQELQQKKQSMSHSEYEQYTYRILEQLGAEYLKSE